MAERDDLFPDRNLSRRALMRTAGITGAGALLAGGAHAAVPSVLGAVPSLPLLDGVTAPPAALATAAEAAGPAAAVLTRMCTLTPAQTEGPYYLNRQLLRRDITEAKPGLPFYLFFLVVRASDCSAVPNAIVDVWHCDAGGAYSGFANQGTLGQTFLRGIQTTDAGGLVIFQTIYPGYYPGRTSHIHFKVILQNQTVVTSQTYFPDPITDVVYRVLPPYNARAPRGTNNANDNIFDARNMKVVIAAPDGSLAVWGGMIIGIA
jgi:protocatechuate 3,4-dioxygenase beta subunit